MQLQKLWCQTDIISLFQKSTFVHVIDPSSPFPEFGTDLALIYIIISFIHIIRDFYINSCHSNEMNENSYYVQRI